MYRSPRQKISKEMSELSHTLGQMNLRDVDRTFHPTAAEKHILLTCTLNILQDRSLIDHKTSLSKFKIEIVSDIFSNHNGMK